MVSDADNPVSYNKRLPISSEAFALVGYAAQIQEHKVTRIVAERR